jgi:predicted DNA-binding protein YlxM (UPF0122 family)
VDYKDYSVVEAARLLNVTRQSIYNKLNSLKDILQPYIKIKNNTKYLTEQAVEIIKKDLNGENVKGQIYNDVNDGLTNLYKSQINDLQNSIETIKSLYEEQISFLRNDYLKQLEYIKSESEKKTNQLETKDKLLENMQILLRDQKLLIESKNKIWWKFWKKKI